MEKHSGALSSAQKEKLNERIMLRKIILSFSAAALSVLCASGKTPGKIVYSLPSTTVSMEVEAVREAFHAGPYAEYAMKYLGVEAKLEDKTTYTVTGIRLVPYVEADPTAVYEINTGASSVTSADFLKLSSQGLVSLPGGFSERPEIWRFPSQSPAGGFAGAASGNNFSSETVELYRMEERDGVYERVSVQQTQVVAKSLEKKAAETAAAIFRLREKREQIITGDTDATFDGEALGAAIAEITRLEEQYMTMFLGYTDYSVQRMNFDFSPKKGDGQVYVVFRISDEAGLLPSDNMSGRPVVATLEIEGGKTDAKVSGSEKMTDLVLFYRMPAVAVVKVTDGTTLLSQSRIPFYQLGETLSMPVRLLK